MDQASLRRLAEQGFRGVPADRLRALADWCWDYGEASGDARFCSLARTLWMIDDWWTEHDAVDPAVAADIESAIVADLGAVLDAEDPASGSMLARSMRQRVGPRLLPPEQWPSQRG